MNRNHNGLGHVLLGVGWGGLGTTMREVQCSKFHKILEFKAGQRLLCEFVHMHEPARAAAICTTNVINFIFKLYASTLYSIQNFN